MASHLPFPADDFGAYYILAECADCDSLPESETQPHFQGVTGLRNLGNTCYMNTILQCLCSVSPLVEYFLSGKYITALQKGCSEVTTAFAYLMTDMWLGDSECVSPAIFLSAVGSRYPAFLKKTQQDAQEFLIYILNELHEALKKHCRRRACEKRTTQNCCRKVPARETSIVTRLFEGQLSYSITCLKCETCSYKNEVFTILSLPIPSEYECSLQDCLQCFFQQDTLTWNNQIQCSFCEIKQETAVRTTISKAPKIIVLHLKRFDIQGTVKRKLRTDIHYPLTNLDLTPYICPVFRKHPKYNLCAVVCRHQTSIGKTLILFYANEPCSMCQIFRIRNHHPHCYTYGLFFHCAKTPSPTHMFYLSALDHWSIAVNHFGDLDGGHYTAFCKNSVTQAWYSFDDTRVSEIPDTSVRTAAAYLLFYSCQPFSIPTQKHKS